MHCREIQDLLSAYLDGMLDPSEKLSVERHLESCPACLSEMNDIKGALSLVRNLPPVEPPPEFRQNLRLKLEQINKGKRKPGFLPGLFTGRWPGMVAAAACFMLVIGAAAMWYGNPTISSNYAAGTVKQEAVKSQLSDPAGSGAPAENTGQGIVADNSSLQSGAAPNATRTSPPAPVTASAPAQPSTASKSVRDAPAVREEQESPPAVKYSQTAGRDIKSDSVNGAGQSTLTSGPVLPRLAIVEMKVADMTSAVRDVSAATAKYGGTFSVLEKEITIWVPGVKMEALVADLGGIGKITSQEYPSREAPGRGGGDGSVEATAKMSPLVAQEAPSKGTEAQVKLPAAQGAAGSQVMGMIIVRLQ